MTADADWSKIMRRTRLVLLLSVVAFAWTSGWSLARNEPIRGVIGLVMALAATQAVRWMAELRVHA